MNIGICGSGKMGNNLFQYLQEFDFDIYWLCETEEESLHQQNQFIKKINRQMKNGLIDEAAFKRKQAQIHFSDSPETLAGCDLIIEAITEKVDAKQQLFLQLDKICKPESIFVSNSSSILPQYLIPSPKRAKNVAGLHFFYPVALKNITEFVLTQNTSAKTIEIITSFLKNIHHFYLIQKDNNNVFLLNRMFLGIQNEACKIFREEISNPEVIDAIVKESLFPTTGIFDFFDSVGIDVMLMSVKNYAALSPGEGKYIPLIQCLEKKYAEGNLGMKSQKGFYNYCKKDDFETTYISPKKKENIALRLLRAWKLSLGEALNAQPTTEKELKYALAEYLGMEEAKLPWIS